MKILIVNIFGVILIFAVAAEAQPLTVLWDRSGEGAQSHFGAAVFSLGDQNDDGFDDWAVLSWGTGPAGQPSEAKMSFFHGGNPPPLYPFLEIVRDPDSTIEPFDAGVTGDLNGDGYTDWFRKTRYPDHPDSFRVEVFFGGPNADLIPDLCFHLPLFHAVLPSGNIGGHFDFDGDGYDDLYIYIQIEHGDYGYVLYGGSPMDTIPDLVFHSNPQGSQSAAPRAFGDINGDGYGDFLTSNNYVTQTIYIFLGGNPPDTLADYEWYNFRVGDCTLQPDLNADGRADLCIARFEAIDVHFGGNVLSRIPNFTLSFPQCDGGPWELGSAGDFNGDGYGDLAAVDPSCNLSHGGLKLYLGHPWLYPDPVIEIYGRQAPLDLVGILHATRLGDVNGDGIEDLAIGATNEETEGQRGRVVILSGDTTLRADADRPHAALPSDLCVTVFPNPFNSQTTIRFNVPVFAAQLVLKLYNLLGQAVQEVTLRDVRGMTQYHFDAEALATGVYLLRVQAGSLTNTQKLMVLR